MTYIIHFIKHTPSGDIEKECLVVYDSDDPFDEVGFLTKSNGFMEEIIIPYVNGDGMVLQGIYELDQVFSPADGASLPCEEFGARR